MASPAPAEPVADHAPAAVVAPSPSAEPPLAVPVEAVRAAPSATSSALPPTSTALELPSPDPHLSRGGVGRDLYYSANRRLIFGPLNAAAAGATGLGAMALWSTSGHFTAGAVAVTSEGFAITGYALLASGVQMQRRAQVAFGYEPEPNPYYAAGLAFGAGALVVGAITPGALSTNSRPLIYSTTGGAAALGVTGMTLLILAEVRETNRTRPMVDASWVTRKVSLNVTPAGIAGTW